MNRWVLICYCLLFAGIVTGIVADTYWPEHRFLIGFTVSTSVILISEALQVADGARVSSSLLDVGSHVIGAMIGATITDRCFLAPVVERNTAGNVRVGIVMRQIF